MKKTVILMLVLIAATLSGCARKTARIPAPEKGIGTLAVELEGFRNDRGDVIVSL